MLGMKEEGMKKEEEEEKKVEEIKKGLKKTTHKR